MLIYETRRIRKENYNKLRPHRVAFAIFVDFREDYSTFDFYIFHQAKQNRIFSRQKLVQTQELSYYVPVFLTKHGINWRRLEKRFPNTYLKFEPGCNPCKLRKRSSTQFFAFFDTIL